MNVSSSCDIAHVSRLRLHPTLKAGLHFYSFESGEQCDHCNLDLNVAILLGPHFIQTHFLFSRSVDRTIFTSPYKMDVIFIGPEGSWASVIPLPFHKSHPHHETHRQYTLFGKKETKNKLRKLCFHTIYHQSSLYIYILIINGTIDHNDLYMAPHHCTMITRDN